MRTTLDLPDHLIIEVKIRAAKEKRKMKDVIAEALEKGLRLDGGASPSQVSSELEAYLKRGGMNKKKAEQWIEQIAEDRENYRSSDV